MLNVPSVREDALGDPDLNALELSIARRVGTCCQKLGWIAVFAACGVGMGPRIGTDTFAADPPAEVAPDASPDAKPVLTDTRSKKNVRRTMPKAWPRFLSADFSGRAVRPPSADVAAPPKPLWTLPVGAGYGLGVVADNTYYHFDAVAGDGGTAGVRSGSLRQRLRAIRVDDGQEIWRQSQPIAYRDMYGYEAGPRSSPTIAGDAIVTMGVSGALTCHDRDGGEVRWSVDTSERFGVVQNFFGVGGSPLVIGNTVIVMVGGSPPEDAELPPGRLDRVSAAGSLLTAWDLRDGTLLWSSGEDLASYSSPRPIELEGQTFVLMFGREFLWLIDASSGEVGWRFRHRAEILESVNAMTPVVFGDRVFISECYALGSVLLEVTPSEAEVVWSDPAGDRRSQSMRSHWSNPVVIGDYLYGPSGRNAPDSDFRCVRWTDGEVMWQALSRQRTSVTGWGDHLWVLSEYGELRLVRADPRRFELIAKYDLGDLPGHEPTDAETGPMRYPCWAAPIIVGDLMWLRDDERVFCLRIGGPPADIDRGPNKR